MLYARTHAKQRAHGCSYHPQPDQTRPNHQTVAACKVSPSETDIIITIMIMITIIDIDIDIDRRQVRNVPQDAGLCCIMGCRCRFRCRCRWERYISRHVPGDVRLGFGFGFGFALIFTYSHIHIFTLTRHWYVDQIALNPRIWFHVYTTSASGVCVIWLVRSIFP